MKFKIKKLNDNFHHDWTFTAKSRKIAETPNYILTEDIYNEKAEKTPKRHYIVKKKGFMGDEISTSKTEKAGLQELKNAEKYKEKIVTKFSTEMNY